MKPPSHYGHPRRPYIAVTPDLGQTQSAFPAPRYELKTAYSEAVFRAGGLPWIVPYSEEKSVIEAYLDRVSGVLLTGGAFDVPPEFYGESPRQGLGEIKPARTQFELLLLKAALLRNLPVLGVCGGMQLLNVAAGGTLFQDIKNECPKARTHEQSNERDQPHHPVDVKPNTLLAAMVGKGQLMVNSTHHQAVNKLGEKVLVSAVAPDGVLEGIEIPTYEFAVGVQWHPENLIDSMPIHLSIYKAFVQKAKEHRR